MSAIHTTAEDLEAGQRSPDGLTKLRQWLGAKAGFHWSEVSALALFGALVAWAIPFHEPWSDEAQAWQLARSLPLGELFRSWIRYEASPGLWHFVLWCLIRVRVSYAGLHWICGAIAIAAAGLLIFRSPFPRYLRLTLPFTYFLLFQYAVIARSYVLVPPILFLLAMRWRKSPVVVALLLGLLANLSLHAAVISGGLAVVFFVERLRRGDFADGKSRRWLLLAAAMIVCFYAFAIWTAWPPHDLPIAGFRGQSRPFLLYFIVSLLLGVCQPWPLAILIWIAVTICLRARKSLLYLLPVLFFAVFSGAAYALFWHAGLMVPLLICILWITWPAAENATTRSEMAGRRALVLLAAVQILWSGFALSYDHFHAYSPAKETAAFLQPLVREGATVAITYLNQEQSQDFDGVAILPYFDRNIFINQRTPFYEWSDKNPTEENFRAVLPNRPRIVLMLAWPKDDEPIDLTAPKVTQLAQAGYRLTNQFCGRMPAGLGFAGGPKCNLIFQYSGAADAPQAQATPR